MRKPAMMLVAVTVLLTAAAPAAAETRRTEDPTHSIQFRVGAFFPTGGGTFWDDTERTFDLDIGDLQDFSLGFTYVAGVNNWLEVGFNADLYRSESRSAYRTDEWVDQLGLPILHDTRLRLLPLTVDLRGLPAGRYTLRGDDRQHRVRKPVPYLGLGFGVKFWEYQEKGDFLDFSLDPPEVFYARYKESGAALEGHALAGVELPLGKRTSILFEGRYSWASANPGGDFAGLGRMRLDGASAYVGFARHF